MKKIGISILFLMFLAVFAAGASADYISTPNVTGWNMPINNSAQLLWLKKFKQMDSTHDLYSDCVMGFNLDETDGSGTVNMTDSCGGYTGVPQSNPVMDEYSVLGLNTGFTGDGSADYIRIENSTFDSYTEGTVTGWVKYDTDSNAAMFGCGNTGNTQYYAIGYLTGSDGGKIGMYSYDGSGGAQIRVLTDNSYSDGNWHMYAYAVNGSGNKIYIDGVEAAVTYSAGSAASTEFFDDGDSPTNVCGIGARTRSTPGAYWPGELDDVYLFDRRLTADEISDLYYDSMHDIMNSSEDFSDIEVYDDDTDTTVPFVTIADGPMGIYDSYVPDDACDIWSNSLVSWHKLDEASGASTAEDTCDDTYNATNSNTDEGEDSTWLFNNSYGFDGSSSYVEFDTATSNFGGNYTIMLWIYPEDRADDNTPLYLRTNNLIAIKYDTSDTEFSCLVKDSGGWKEASIDWTYVPADEWTLITMDYDGTNINCRANDEAIGSIAAGSPTGDGGDSDALGAEVRDPEGEDEHWQGYIDNVLIFNKSLDQLGGESFLKRFIGTEAIYIPSPYYNQTTNISTNIEVSTNGATTNSTNEGTNNDLSFWFPFEPGINDAQLKDFSGEGIDASNAGNAAFWQNSSCNHGSGSDSGCYYFDGSTYLTVPNTESGYDAQDFSLSFWANMDSNPSPSYRRFFFKYGTDGWNLNHWNDDGLEFYVKNGGTADHFGTTGLTLSTMGWTHIAVTWNQTSKAGKIYVNGVLNASDTMSQSIGAENRIISIGREDDGTDYLIGKLDNVRFINRTLPADEVLGLYNEGQHRADWWTSQQGSNETPPSGGANESAGRAAIETGISNALPGNYTIYTDQQVYGRHTNTSQDYGTFDKFVVYSDKRWAFNYDQNTSAGFTDMFNLTPVLYVLETYNLTTEDITAEVENLINTTKD